MLFRLVELCVQHLHDIRGQPLSDIEVFDTYGIEFLVRILGPDEDLVLQLYQLLVVA